MVHDQETSALGNGTPRQAAASRYEFQAVQCARFNLAVTLEEFGILLVIPIGGAVAFGVIALKRSVENRLRNFRMTLDAAREREHQAGVDAALEQMRAVEHERLRAHFRRFPDHIGVLHGIASRTIYRDEFEDIETAEWHKQLRKYLDAKLGVKPIDAFEHEMANMMLVWTEEVLRELWAEEKRPLPLAPKVSDGTDFERQCGDVFRELGYETRHCGGSGDQGADLIVVKEGLTTVVQCKCYSGSVGNDAVQQAAAARGYYEAGHAIVVSNAEFTTSARQLAQKLNVELVAFSRLREVLGIRE
jgi:HJR/Mrr/RecB family endonuclease